jgi:fatty acid desaturase
MNTDVFNKTRLQKVKYKDLLVLNRWEVVREIFLSLPWLIAALYFMYAQVIIPALLCSFWFFLTGLRQAHNAYHYTLGVSKWASEWMLVVLSVIMIMPLHVVKYNHLQHHKHCLSEKDIEGKSARMPWWKALLYGPIFPFELTRNALKNGKKSLRQWVVLEMCLIVCVYSLLAFFCFHRVLLFHIVTMISGECLTAFFAVWTVHHDCEPDEVFSRTIRGSWKPKLFYGLFYHTEHHLYPQVPTCKLSKLAERVDEEFPEVKSKIVL